MPFSSGSMEIPRIMTHRVSRGNDGSATPAVASRTLPFPGCGGKIKRPPDFNSGSLQLEMQVTENGESCCIIGPGFYLWEQAENNRRSFGHPNQTIRPNIIAEKCSNFKTIKEISKTLR